MTDTSNVADSPSPDVGGGRVDDATTAPPPSADATSANGDDREAPSPEQFGLSLPDDPSEARALLLRELDEARQESGELLSNLQRVAAEFDNYRKRTERDQIDNVRRASQRVIESLLPTLDSLDAALAIEATTETEERMLDGMQGTKALLLEALSADDFAPIETVGAPFDPAVHEAVSVIPGEGDQVVTEELRKGYVMQGRVIRPALVIVGHA